MSFPVLHRHGVVGVGVAAVAEMRAGVVLADVLGHDATTGEALALVLQAGVATLLENEIRPHKMLINTMTAFAGTPLDEDIRNGSFIPAGEKENLVEERELLSRLELPDAYFWAVHPLDSVKIEGWIGHDRDRMLNALDWSISHVDDSTPNLEKVSLGY